MTAARHIDGECSANRIKQKTDHPKTPDPPTQFVEEPVLFASAANASGKIHVVEMLNKSPVNKKERMVFEPSMIKINVGDTVRFISKDRGHNTASIKGMLPTGSQKWKSRLGKDFEVTYKQDGTYGFT